VANRQPERPFPWQQREKGVVTFRGPFAHTFFPMRILPHSLAKHKPFTGEDFRDKVRRKLVSSQQSGVITQKPTKNLIPKA
jgi:hypothetical protein